MFPAFAHFRRTATCDTELAGQRIREGEKVVMWYVSSGRDESRYADPDRFDVRRNPEHQAFGAGGRHFCLGTALARLELRVLFEETLAPPPEHGAGRRADVGHVDVRQPAEDAAGQARVGASAAREQAHLVRNAGGVDAPLGPELAQDVRHVHAGGAGADVAGRRRSRGWCDPRRAARAPRARGGSAPERRSVAAGDAAIERVDRLDRQVDRGVELAGTAVRPGRGELPDVQPALERRRAARDRAPRPAGSGSRAARAGHRPRPGSRLPARDRGAPAPRRRSPRARSRRASGRPDAGAPAAPRAASARSRRRAGARAGRRSPARAAPTRSPPGSRARGRSPAPPRAAGWASSSSPPVERAGAEVDQRRRASPGGRRRA